MTRRTTVQVVAAVVIAVFAIGLWSSGDELKATWLRYYSVAVLAAVIVLAVWDRWLWRLPPAQRLDGVPPAVTGTWKATIVSLWTDPASGEKPDPIEAFVVIRQTASNVNVRVLTKESTSRSTAASVTRSDGTGCLDYAYVNRPRPSVEDRSRMHHGAASLEISGAPGRRLHGRYWTDRETRGELDLTTRHKKHAADFEEAAQFFE